MWSTWPGYNPNHRWVKEALSTSKLENNSEVVPTNGLPSIDVDSVLESSAPSSGAWTRPLGLIETKFDLAAQNDGQGDVFVRMKTRVPAHGVDVLQRRVLLAWTRLRTLHLSLAYTVHDGPQGEMQHVPGVRNRVFRYHVPQNDRDAIEQAWRTVHVQHSSDPGKAARELQQQQVLNGPRSQLQQSSCLARMVVIINDAQSSDADSHLDPVFMLALSHVISDGISIVNAMRDFFELLTSPWPPTPPTSPPYTRCLDELDPDSVFLWDVAPGVLSAWNLTAPEAEQLSQLTLATEDLWPSLPLDSPNSASVARKRWFWAITRTIMLNRHRRAPEMFAFPRLSFAGVGNELPRTEWLTLKLNVEKSQRIVGVCRRERISPSMLLYSIMSIVVSRFFASATSSLGYRPLKIGFPSSIRPFLDPSLKAKGPDFTSDLAIRLTFGHIALPFYDTEAQELCGERLKWRIFKGARLAKRQFDTRFREQERGFFLADNYHRMLFRVLSAAGQDPVPIEEPSTVINASMIGDLDRLLPSSFPLLATLENKASNTPPPTLDITDLSIGTRLHRGEGMFTEVYTFGRRLYVSVGFDEQIYEKAFIESSILGAIESVLLRVD
ncbi:BZ3500_MvSof-1268-A1-R1_Chr2-1g04236 [Microbotryum saponariae]|uniref:BZ3500_MvSof-1268-A1-R1_Chr2-1g04236 protein n=1 Tax=Microbotryum saponariae TaxID=289078 RepID=A0A2X0KPX4_9BASI|nr:BZ3500_MvSof-1268-A1-R1_Chr2-1g04236 [Microbotryum saponariae]SCZ91223.1 BZ3501_MvSof-1269-A2-R1_Chr2-1g03892 [Microbotryum saponariae]